MNIDLNTLHDAVYTALRQWNEPESGSSPLAPLILYRQAQLRNDANPHQLTNEILLQALDALAQENPDDAGLLRQRFIEQIKVHLLAKKLNVGEATIYRRQNEAVQRLADTLYAQEQAAQTARLVELEQRFDLPSAVELIGPTQHKTDLLQLLIDPGPPWILSIEGLGGMGKTALANALFRQPELLARFGALAWVSAKQGEFFDMFHTDEMLPPALPATLLIDQLLRQLLPDSPLPASPQERETRLLGHLKQTPTLAVIDNLETVTDSETLLPLLRRAANPGKFLLTSRHSLNLQPDVFCHSLRELEQDDARHFIRREARQRGHLALADASTSDLDSIYQTVGGNPLALKLVVGQTTRLPLPQVLENLRQAQGDKVDKFYTFIYWQAWNLLDEASRQLLLMMPLAPPQGSGLEQLVAVSGLDAGALSQAIEQLAALSLLEVSGGLSECRYRIHRLTETFLLTEVAKWQ